MIRKTRSDKKTRVNPALDNDTHQLLCRLALACGLTKTGLAEQIIAIALNTGDFVHHLQNINAADKFRIITTVENGKIKYMDADVQ